MTSGISLNIAGKGVDFLRAKTEEASRLRLALRAIDNQSLTEIDTVDLETLEGLGLAAKDGASVYLTTEGQELLVQEGQEPNLENILSSQDSPEVLRELLAGTIFVLLLSSETQEKIDAEILPDMGLPDLKPTGKIAGYLRGLPEKKIQQLAGCCRPFFTKINAIRDALGCKITNKVIINCMTDDKVNRNCREMVTYCLENYSDIAGNPEANNLTFVAPQRFFNALSRASGYEHASAEELVFRAFLYATTGKSDDVLSRKPKKRVSAKKALISDLKNVNSEDLEMIKAAIGDSENDQGKPILLFNRSLNVNILATLSRALSTSSIRDINPEFAKKLESTPMIGIANKTPKTTTTDNRNRVFDLHKSAVPLVTADLMGMPSEKREELESTRFMSELIRTPDIYLPGISLPLHLLESMQNKAGKPNDTWFEKTEILEYILENSQQLSASGLDYILSLCYEFGFLEISAKVRHLVVKKFALSPYKIDSFESLAQSYKPERIGPGYRGGAIDELTHEDYFFSDHHNILGVKPEVDALVESLGKGDSSAMVVDMTNFSEESVKGSYYPMHKRIGFSLANRIMNGDVPESLKNAAVLEMQIDSDTAEVKAFKRSMKIASEGIQFDPQAIRAFLVYMLNYNPNIILMLNLPDHQADSRAMASFVEFATGLGIKVIIQGSRPLPGIENCVTFSPIAEEELKKRIFAEKSHIEKRAGVKISNELIQNIVSRVTSLRSPEQDPLHLALEIIWSAAIVAKAKKKDEIEGSSVADSLAFNLGMIDPQLTTHLIMSLRSLPAVLKKEIKGQDAVIDRFTDAVTTHLIGAGNPERPLALMYPGPTGVGKTWLAELVNKHFGIPTLMIDGSMYKEPHSVARLTGSPPGYHGDDEGLVTNFLRDHDQGIIFIDEIDKMNPEVRSAIMNLADEGKMTSGGGITYKKRGMIIITATNAGADKLTPGMTKREILECIGAAFEDDKGVPKPELAARYTIDPMLGIPEADFKEAISDNLWKINERPALINVQSRITKIDPSVIDAIFQDCEGPCQTHETAKEIGFGKIKPPIAQLEMEEAFFNLRQIVRSVDALCGPAINHLVMSRLEDKNNMPQQIELTTNLEGKIILEEA